MQTQFITLHDADGNTHKISVARIVSLSEVRNGTLVTCDGKIVCIVKETVKEIESKLAGITISEG